MPFYESVFLVRADVSSQQVEALAQSFADIIADNGGSVAKTEHWGLRSLAYRIKKNRKAHYVLFNIDGPPAAAQEMERNMGLNEDVLRTLTLRVDELEEGPSAVLQSRGRDDRGRRDRPSRSDGFAGHGRDRVKPAPDKGGDTTESKPAAAVEPEAAAKSEVAGENAGAPEPAKAAETPADAEAISEPQAGDATAEAESSDEKGDAK